LNDSPSSCQSSFLSLKAGFSHNQRSRKKERKRASHEVGLKARDPNKKKKNKKNNTINTTKSGQATFAAAKERTVRFTELPSPVPYSELHFFGQKRTERFAWMAGPGIYHGQINLGAQHRWVDFSFPVESNIHHLRVANLLPLTRSVRSCMFLSLTVGWLSSNDARNTIPPACQW
jgi:hypothetical protein